MDNIYFDVCALWVGGGGLRQLIGHTGPSNIHRRSGSDRRPAATHCDAPAGTDRHADPCADAVTHRDPGAHSHICARVSRSYRCF